MSTPYRPFTFRMDVTKLAIITGLSMSTTAVAAPKPGDHVLVTLKTGETLRGMLVATEDEAIVINHPTLGELTIAKNGLDAFVAADQQPASEDAAQPPSTPAPPAEEHGLDPGAPRSFFEGWTGTVELGLSGASGNTERFGFRTGLGATRETKEMITTTSLVYLYATESSNTTEHRARLQARNDWRLGDSRWRVFALGSGEYDQFQDWNWRVSGFGGLGYEFIMDDTTELIGRIGAGATREFGGSDNTIRPEGLLGLDFSHRLTDRQRIMASVDFFPALDEFGDYRFNAQAAYEILVDPDTNMALRIGVEDRYDSSPGPERKRNDISYFALLTWEF